MAQVGDITAKLKLDTSDFTKNAEAVEGKTKKLSANIAGFFGKVTTAAGAAVVAAGAALGKVVSDAVKSYAEYEQLVGGVETLFKDSAGIIEDYAMEAYKTAGISANKYMEQATSFSAALLQSLGGDTEKAAEITNMAIIDMADNAAKMGSTIESIQNAYQGFAKQNYTMLDNLKLGYGGTRGEMERLLADAEKLTGIKYDIENLNDVFNAIHAIQEEMGIAGTTAKEAESTISGSLNMVKASWQDLMTSVAGGGKGMSEAIQSLVESAKAFAKNVIPVVQEALYGIGDLINGLAPIIAEALPPLVTTLLPQLIEAALSLISGLVNALPGILETLMVSAAPLLFSAALDILTTLVTGIAENIDTLAPAAISMISQIVLSIGEHLPEIISGAIVIIEGLVMGIVNNLPMIIDTVVRVVGSILTTLTECFPQLLEAGINIVVNIAWGIITAIPQIIGAIGQMLAGVMISIVSFIGDIISTIGSFFGKLLGIQSDKNDNIVKNSQKTTSAVSAQSQSMITGLNSTASQTASLDSKILSAHSDTMKGIDTGTQSTQTMTKTQMESITTQSRITTDNVKHSTDLIHEYSWNAMHDLTVLGDMYVNPRIDASSVVSACNEIVSAVDRAISALQNLSSAGGGGISIGAFASGGDYGANQPFIAGELGPELIVPSTSGHVYTADETEDIIGARSVTIVIEGDVYDDENSFREKFRSAVTDVMEEQVAYGW